MPWLDFFSENIFMQLLILITIVFFKTVRSFFYKLVYMSLLVFWFGIVLAYLNIELLSGFLWVVELSVIFIFIIFLFYLNYTSNLAEHFNVKYNFVLVIFIIAFVPFLDDYYNLDSEYSFLYNDYYEAASNFLLNDISSIYISFFLINNFLICLLGFLIFLASMLCVNLLFFSKLTLVNSSKALLKTYNFFLDLLDVSVFRSQNMTSQQSTKPKLKFFRKKSKNGTKRKRFNSRR